MRAFDVVLVFSFVSTCHGRRVRAAEQPAPKNRAAQSFAQTSQEAPGRTPMEAVAMLLVASNPAAAFTNPRAVGRASALRAMHSGGALTQQAPPVMQMRPLVDAAPGAADFRGGGRVTQAPPGPDSAQLVQGGSLRTWTYRSPAVEQVQVVLSTEGRPLDADIELWHGPDNTPVKMRVYVENGEVRPFSAVIETPRGPNTVAIRNIGQLEFPIAANVVADIVDQPSGECLSSSMTIQGGALRTYPFDPSVDSVQVLLKTDGRPLNARIELLQGPNNNKQVVELYTEDGLDRPFFCFLATPGAGNVVRVVNTAPVEFPLTASVVPHSINEDVMSRGGDAIIGGDISW